MVYLHARVMSQNRSVLERERERERERHTYIHTYIHTDRQTDRQLVFTVVLSHKKSHSKRRQEKAQRKTPIRNIWRQIYANHKKSFLRRNTPESQPYVRHPPQTSGTFRVDRRAPQTSSAEGKASQVRRKTLISGLKEFSR